MDRINTVFMAAGRRFRDRIKSIGQEATYVSATWFNNVQGEIINFIEALGLTPDAANETQLMQASKLLIGRHQARAYQDLLIGCEGGLCTITGKHVVFRSATQTSVVADVFEGIDPAVTGLGGITGGVAANRWYQAWLCRRASDGDVRAFATTGAMPSDLGDYTERAWVGVVQMSSSPGSGYFRPSLQNGEDFQFVNDGTIPLPLAASGSAGNPDTPTLSEVSLSGLIPAFNGGAGRTMIKIQASKNSGSPTKFVMSSSANYGAWTSLNPPLHVSCGTMSTSALVEFLIESSSPKIYYASDETNTYLHVLGFRQRTLPYPHL